MSVSLLTNQAATLARNNLSSVSAKLQQSRLQFAKEQLTVNQSNLESARSRIMDVDVAAESTQLARFNILQQAGAAMLSQANQSQQIALRLLG